MKIFTKKLASFAVGAALAGMTSGALAGGFAIGTQSGSGTGNAFAGGAAGADDASVAWYNPAGMMLLPSGKQAAVALHALNPSFKFQNQGSTGAFASPPASTNDGGDGGDWAFVPNAFFTMDINPKFRFGLALNVPFGLKTEYDAGWRGQITALKSEIKTVNINPSIAYNVGDRLSVGVGVSIQKIEAELSRFSGAGVVGNVILNADDVGYGYNFGLLFKATPATRIGASYRSSIKYELEGTATGTGPLAVAAAGLNVGVKADLRVPDSASFSVFHQLNPKWELMGDITWTGWSSVQNLVVFRTAASGPAAAGSVLTTLPFLWDDTLRYSVGANYKFNANTKLRLGAALDESPTNDVTRTPRLPDQERKWLAIGVQHRLSKAGVLDVGYAHEFIKDAAISAAEAGIPGRLNGSFTNKADILSVQYSHSF